MQQLPISATIIVKNAQKTIKECLESLKDFDEVILLDNDSSDDTLTIAKNFPNVRVFHSEFIGFGALKNLAISYAKNDWIFSIDSDEVLESAALQAITNIELQNNTIYSFSRKNLYNGEWIKACGWYPDYVKRLFNKHTTRFNNNYVHESIIVPQQCREIVLQGTIKHYAYTTITQLIDKMQYYSSLWAEQRITKKSSVSNATIRSIWKFLKDYLLKKGFLYGYKGFVISVCNALGVFFKYMKIYELQHNRPQSCSLIVTTYNQKERLALVLDSITKLNPLPNEVLIADDGSKEDTKELVESYAINFPCKLQHIWQEDDGFRLSAVRNLAIKKAMSEYIIIIDGDMILESNFINDHLKYARKKVFLQGSRVILDIDTSKCLLERREIINCYSKGNIKSNRINILSNFIYNNSKLDSTFFQKRNFIKGIRGCNMSFYKSDCEAINGFNEDFIGWGREDSEFVARFLFNNGEMRRLKFAGIAYHLYHDENTRDMLESNHKIYLDCIKNKSNWCKNGLKKNLE